MRVFVAGATGVVGQPLVRKLLAAGHDVTGTTRSQDRAAQIEAAGATAVVCDALDADSVALAVEGAGPEVVVNQLTNLPTDGNQRKSGYFDSTNRLRREGGRILIEAAQSAGVKRLVTQSIAFTYMPEGSRVKDESAPTMGGFPGPQGEAFAAMLDHERSVLEADGLEGLVLRYGFFYGPGTYYANDGATAEEVRKRRYPVVGAGTGTFSFVHVDDAADAACLAVSAGSQGIYNVVDDEPAALKDWLPVYAEALGARPPRKVPFWLARLIAGKGLAEAAIGMRGASNGKARDELGWTPAHSSWRTGFAESFG